MKFRCYRRSSNTSRQQWLVDIGRRSAAEGRCYGVMALRFQLKRADLPSSWVPSYPSSFSPRQEAGGEAIATILPAVFSMGPVIVRSPPPPQPSAWITIGSSTYLLTARPIHPPACLVARGAGSSFELAVGCQLKIQGASVHGLRTANDWAAGQQAAQQLCPTITIVSRPAKVQVQGLGQSKVSSQVQGLSPGSQVSLRCQLFTINTVEQVGPQVYGCGQGRLGRSPSLSRANSTGTEEEGAAYVKILVAFGAPAPSSFFWTGMLVGFLLGVSSAFIGSRLSSSSWIDSESEPILTGPGNLVSFFVWGKTIQQGSAKFNQFPVTNPGMGGWEKSLLRPMLRRNPNPLTPTHSTLCLQALKGTTLHRTTFLSVGSKREDLQSMLEIFLGRRSTAEDSICGRTASSRSLAELDATSGLLDPRGARTPLTTDQCNIAMHAAVPDREFIILTRPKRNPPPHVCSVNRLVGAV
ncbi:hypothetical protein THAOC_20060 [Thalassiosira oceanica]|uniref:Uncharacterized protein n=1 Tax=Thalassiosira oceanica TaxID=159749 RepID=K0SFL8_THAOC|nr:hypothetical protein THAOC_20060 [Thalassiosira oceanica]|eukprot:EJK59681.1 hypothetical protein THAOC_20060 [Thalassiosira oceanica]